MSRRVWVVCVLGALGAISCDDDGREPMFPEDYLSTYVEVRDCRQSGDHDLNQVRILADPAALVPYRDRLEPFPEGAVVIKEEYEFGDVDCSGPIRQWTVMVKLAEGADPANLDWFWERVSASRRVVDEQNPRCAGCHDDCVPPDGYDFTCTVP